MKKNEKLLIAVLVIITLVVIIFAATRSKDNSNENALSNAGTTVTGGDVENLEEPVVEKYV